MSRDGLLPSVEELQANLDMYREQLEQEKQTLRENPDNSECKEVVKGLEEVIELTQDLLQSAIRQGGEADETDAPGSQQTYLGGDLEQRFRPGSKVQARWSEDGEWYRATVEAATDTGYLVVYDEWGNREEVDASRVRYAGKLVEEEEEDNDEVDALLEAEREAEATKQAIKRKIANAADLEITHKDLPTKLRINADDPEDVKAAKRKKIHAFKSKLRIEHLELTQNKRQNAWHQFQSAKGKAKKVGFYTGRKRESIFKSPDDPKGKVGVTGSGKGITEFQKREKHLHMKVGVEDWQ